MRTYSELQTEYRDALARLDELSVEFCSCVYSKQELSGEHVRQEVLALYDQITQSADLKAAEYLPNILPYGVRTILEVVWTNDSCAEFVEACAGFYTLFLCLAHPYATEPQVQARALFVKKNSDYRSTFLRMGVPGILTRLGDKVERAGTLWNKPIAQVVDESLGDTLVDAANYSIMAAICHKLSRGATLPET